MNDIFIEQLVKKKRTIRDRIIFIMVILFVVLIPVSALLMVHVFGKNVGYFAYISIFLFFFGIWFIWFVRSHQNQEFEYQMVSDTLVVSKIIAKRKRKEMLRLDVRKIDMLGKLNEIDKSNQTLVKVYDAAEKSSDYENTYCAVFLGATGSKRGLFFNPNERVLEAMKPYLKKEIVLKLFYNRG